MVALHLLAKPREVSCGATAVHCIGCGAMCCNVVLVCVCVGGGLVELGLLLVGLALLLLRPVEDVLQSPIARARARARVTCAMSIPAR